MHIFSVTVDFETYLDFWNIDDSTSVNSFMKWSSSITEKWNGKTRKQGQDAYCLTDIHTAWKERKHSKSTSYSSQTLVLKKELGIVTAK